MIFPQFAHAHNLFYFNFLPLLNIDCLSINLLGFQLCRPYRKAIALHSVLNNVKTAVFRKPQQHLQTHFQLSTAEHSKLMLKIAPSLAGSDDRKFMDTFGRPLYTDQRKHVPKVSTPKLHWATEGVLTLLQCHSAVNWEQSKHNLMKHQPKQS